MWTVTKGSLQHTGDNVVALINGLDKAPEVDDMRVSPCSSSDELTFDLKAFSR